MSKPNRVAIYARVSIHGSTSEPAPGASGGGWAPWLGGCCGVRRRGRQRLARGAARGLDYCPMLAVSRREVDLVSLECRSPRPLTAGPLRRPRRDRSQALRPVPAPAGARHPDACRARPVPDARRLCRVRARHYTGAHRTQAWHAPGAAGKQLGRRPNRDPRLRAKVAELRATGTGMVKIRNSSGSGRRSCSGSCEMNSTARKDRPLPADEPGGSVTWQRPAIALQTAGPHKPGTFTRSVR